MGMKIIYESLNCKLCGSSNIIRFGCYRGIQRWLCKDCRHKFADNDALPGMRMPSNRVASAIGMYYEGRSLNVIPGLVFQQTNSYVTKASVHKWITRFSEIAVSEAKKTRVVVGDSWIANESVIRIGGQNYWLIDIIDSETRFLLATQISSGRSSGDIKTIMEIARAKASKSPRQVITDGWRGYLNGVELAYGADVKHIQSISGDKANFSLLDEYWYNTFKDRTKIMSRLRNKEHAQIILDGWLVHYNYFRLQDALHSRTPGDLAKADFKYHSWTDLVVRYKPGNDVFNRPGPVALYNMRGLRSSLFNEPLKDAFTSNTPLLLSLPKGSDKVVLSKRKPKDNSTVNILRKVMSEV
jgi:transposase-like protein